MEILKNLNELEITSLRSVFEAKRDGLDVQQFEAVLLNASKSVATINPAQLRLRELFSEIDVSGDGYVSWDEFIMFIISRTDGRNKAATGMGLDGVIKNYLLGHVISGEDIPKSIVRMEYIPEVDRIVKMTVDRGVTKVRVLINDMRLTPMFDVPRQPLDSPQVLSCAYIPSEGRHHVDNCLALSYGDGYLKFFDMSKKRISLTKESKMIKSVRLAESQTCMRWSRRYERLVLGSRTGVVSVIHPDEMHVFNQEKLHNLLISDMVVDETLLFTASVDPSHSVKCIDMQRNVVRYSLDDHPQGATMISVNTSNQTLFSVGFEPYIVTHAMLMPRVKPWKLIDTSRPHRGRITQLSVVPSTPQLISSDSWGLTKVWDVRMNGCVQNILPPKDELDITPPEQAAASSLCIVAPSKRIIINGRSTAIYCYEGAVDPAVADELPAHLVILNTASQTAFSFHRGTMKLWDIQSGELLSTHHDVMGDHKDITSAFILKPMERKMFLSSSTGDLLKLSCALCEVETDLSSYVSAVPHCNGQEIQAMAYLQSVRESTTPYVLLAFRRHLLLVPDTEQHSTKSAVEVPLFTQVLPPQVSIKSVDVCKGSSVLVGCSDGRIRMVDMSGLTVTSVWSHPKVLRGDVISLASQGLFGTTGGTIACCTVGAGNVAVGVSVSVGQWDTAEHWDGTEHCESRPQGSTAPLEDSTLLSSDDARRRMSASTTQRSPTQWLAAPGAFNTTTRSSLCVSPPDGAKRGSIAGSSLGGTLHPTLTISEPEPPRSPIADSAVATYLNATSTNQKNRLLSSCVVLVEIVKNFDVLLTADEKGVITLWDLRPCLKHCAVYVSDPVLAPHISHPPILVTWWRAHEEEITSMAVIEDRDAGGQYFSILSASNDKTIRLWSADGILLGSLALGREQSAETLPQGVSPYLFNARSPPREHWSKFCAYLERRDRTSSPLAAPVRATWTARDRTGTNASRNHASAFGIQVAVQGADSARPSVTGSPANQSFTTLPEGTGPLPMMTLQHGPSVTITPSHHGANTPQESMGFFLTQDATLSALELKSSLSHLGHSNSNLRRAQEGRFGGLVKSSVLSRTALKSQQAPRYLGTPGLLASPRRPQHARLPDVSPRRGIDRDLIVTTDEHDEEWRTRSAFRTPLTAHPPPPIKQPLTRKSHEIIQACIDKYEPRTADELLTRRGRITISKTPRPVTRGGESDMESILSTIPTSTPPRTVADPCFSRTPTTIAGGMDGGLFSPGSRGTEPNFPLVTPSKATLDGSETPSARSLKRHLAKF